MNSNGCTQNRDNFSRRKFTVMQYDNVEQIIIIEKLNLIFEMN